MNMQGKTVVLTGATGGIGRAIAHKMASQGASLVLVSRHLDRLEALSAEMQGQGHRELALDLATDAGRQQLVDECGGQVDILINNAGVNAFGLLQDQSPEIVRTAMAVNALAPMLLVQALLPQLSQRGAVGVNVGSGYGSIGYPGYAAYSASKFALRGFSEALRRELADTAVRVLYLAPRATATEMNPEHVVAMNKELGNSVDAPERVADELMRLLARGDGSRYIGWPERFFVKLNGILPGIVDKALQKQLPVVKRSAMAARQAGG